MTDFRIHVSFSPDSNDHQVRFQAGGTDLIARFWGDMLGLDPDDILTQPCPLLAHCRGTVTVARCSCGVTGCGSEEVAVTETGGQVTWSSGGKTVMSVDALKYRSEVVRALNDFSWETPDRTAARLFKAKVDVGALQARSFGFEWASGRVRGGQFTASLRLQEEGLYQVLVSVPWRNVGLRQRPASPDVIADDLLAELAKPPQAWANVEWSPMAQGLGTPKVGGSGWRPLTTG
jgi:hypothetical protein